MIKVDFVVSGDIEANCYFLYDDTTKKTIIIDPGQDDETIISKLNQLKLKPELVINTHGHYDHILSDDIIRTRYNIPLAIHAIDFPMLSDASKNASILIGAPTQIKPAEIIFEKEEEERQSSFCKYFIIHTPGHTQGSVCILVDNLLFSGDTLFYHTIGRTDLPGGNYNQMVSSLEKLKKLDNRIIVYPGHGPSTTIGQELLNNHFLR